jgi:hypothetical protein
MHSNHLALFICKLKGHAKLQSPRRNCCSIARSCRKGPVGHCKSSPPVRQSNTCNAINALGDWLHKKRQQYPTTPQRNKGKQSKKLSISDSSYFFWSLASIPYSCLANLAFFARARLLISFCSACVYPSTILGGASPITAPSSAWVQ